MNSLTKILTIGALVLVVLLVGEKTLPMIAKNNVNSKGYQAVFLTNGQVYFGKISGTKSEYVTLEEIYYLQVQQQVQPQQDEKKEGEPSVSLAKLGSELHGPEDVMYIAKEQVLFWENLKDDGKVVTAIKDYKTKK